MDLKEYHKLCLRTEADDHAMQAARLLDCNALVTERLSEFQDLADELDILKKHIFYGKPLGKEDQALADATPGILMSEQRQRFAMNIRILHGIMGMITECGELVNEMMQHVVEGKSVDRVNILEECCDVDWYKNLTLDAVGFTAEDVPGTLIPKLEVRYARKFDAQRALSRNLEAERSSLEANASGDQATPSRDQEASEG